MEWQDEIKIENIIASAAPYGGPIAVRRDSKKIVKVQGSSQPVIFIFSSAGRQMASLKVFTLFINVIYFYICTVFLSGNADL